MLSLRAARRRENEEGSSDVNVCIAVDEDRGLESSVSGHFGSAPLFLIVDIKSGRYKAVPNSEGGCHSVRAFQGENVGALVVGGIGKGALAAVQAVGIPVLFTEQGTVREVIQAFLEGDVPEPTLRSNCGGHADSGETGHAHGGCGCGGHAESGEVGHAHAGGGGAGEAEAAGCCGGHAHSDGDAHAQGGCGCESEAGGGCGGDCACEGKGEPTEGEGHGGGGHGHGGCQCQ
jgi:predicted Fe-Mo cluster-binding NifX family protein